MAISRSGSGTKPSPSLTEPTQSEQATQTSGGQALGETGAATLATVQRFVETWEGGPNNLHRQRQTNAPRDVKSMKSEGRKLNKRIIEQLTRLSDD